MIPQGDLDAVKARGREVYETHVRLRKSGANYVGLCPFHDEKTPSFTVFPDGGFKCFGCGQHGDAFDFVGDLYNLPTFAERAQLAADYAGVTLSGTGSVQRVQRKPAAPKPKPDELGVWKTDIPPKSSASSKPKLVATYRYVDEDGELLFEKLRFEPGPDGKGGWTYELDDVRKPLFNLPQVLRAEGVVLFVEGEKDVEAAEKLGFVATTVATKKRDWLDEWSKSLARKDVAILPDNDQPGREFAQWALAGIEGTASKARIVELPGLPEKGDDLTDWVSNGGTRDELLKLISESREPGELTYRQLSKVEAQPVNFLWEGRFARGKVSIVAGNPGFGEVSSRHQLRATVSCGGQFPDGSSCDVGNVVMLSAEDDPADTIRPRLDVAGADVARVFVAEAVVEGFKGDGEAGLRSFDLGQDLAGLERMLEEIGGAALIIVDPITAYCGATDSHKNAEVRAMLAPLSEFAAKHNAAVLAVTHLNKNVGSSDALMRISGSLAFVAAARAAYVVGKDPDDEDRRLLLPSKNNIGPDQTGFAFRVEPVSLDTPAGVIETSRVAWEPGEVLTKDYEMLEARRPEERNGVLHDAEEFLAELLSAGPVAAKTIRAEARAAGISSRTLTRAKDSLGVQSEKLGMGHGWVWRLPRDQEECQESPVQNNWHPSHSSGDVGTLREPTIVKGVL